MTAELDHAQAVARHFVDAAAALNILAIFTGMVPLIAGILSIAWFTYQIYDLYDRRRKRKDHGE